MILNFKSVFPKSTNQGQKGDQGRPGLPGRPGKPGFSRPVAHNLYRVEQNMVKTFDTDLLILKFEFELLTASLMISGILLLTFVV